MSLIEIVDGNQLKQIQLKIKKDCVEFNQLSVGSKVKAADQLYTENRILKELGVAAVETIERMDEDIELKNNQVKVLEKELKDINHSSRGVRRLAQPGWVGSGEGDGGIFSL
jgi:predicted metallopeptidase